MGQHLVIEQATRPENLHLTLQEDDSEYTAITFSGRLENSGKGTYRLTGVVKAILTAPCGRCLTPVTHELTAEVSEEYHPGSLETNTGLDDEGYRYEGHAIDIRQALHDNLLLVTPPKVICREDCAGLCPVCGQDLNLGHCKCEDDHPSPVSPFDQLKQLLQDE
jgi:uncharacterized protein